MKTGLLVPIRCIHLVMKQLLTVDNPGTHDTSCIYNLMSVLYIYSSQKEWLNVICCLSGILTHCARLAIRLPHCFFLMLALGKKPSGIRGDVLYRVGFQQQSLLVIFKSVQSMCGMSRSLHLC